MDHIAVNYENAYVWEYSPYDKLNIYMYIKDVYRYITKSKMVVGKKTKKNMRYVILFLPCVLFYIDLLTGGAL